MVNSDHLHLPTAVHLRDFSWVRKLWTNPWIAQFADKLTWINYQKHFKWLMTKQRQNPSTFLDFCNCYYAIIVQAEVLHCLWDLIPLPFHHGAMHTRLDWFRRRHQALRSIFSKVYVAVNHLRLQKGSFQTPQAISLSNRGLSTGANRSTSFPLLSGSFMSHIFQQEDWYSPIFFACVGHTLARFFWVFKRNDTDDDPKWKLHCLTKKSFYRAGIWYLKDLISAHKCRFSVHRWRLFEPTAWILIPCKTLLSTDGTEVGQKADI